MNDPESISESETNEWYSYVNEILGGICFTGAITALQFENYSDEMATVIICFMLLLGVPLAHKKEIRKHIARLERLRGVRRTTINSLLQTPVFVFGSLALIGVSMGFQLESIENFSLKYLLDY